MGLDIFVMCLNPLEITPKGPQSIVTVDVFVVRQD